MQSNGGGYGAPFKRPPEFVLADVFEEKVGIARAAEAYGTVITGDPPAIDLKATERLRTRVGS